MNITREEILKLPKTDLHLHLDGSMRLETILERADKEKIKLPANDPDKLKKHLIKKDSKDLVDYLKAFDLTLKILQTEEGLYRCTYELCEDAHAENVRYLELRFAPVLHTQKGLRLTEIVNPILNAMKKAYRDFGIESGLILCAMRHMDPEISMRTAELAVAFKNKGVVGFDLAGAERDFPAKDHRDSFFLILNNNINCTIHAGEAYGPESIAQAIHYCGAHRLGHGTRLIEDGDLLNYVNDHRIPLEICLNSNLHTQSVQTFEQHPFRLYYDYGLRVTLNTDNRTISDTTMTDELYTACREFNLSRNELSNIILYGFKSTFQSYKAKANMINEVLKPLRDFTLTEGKATTDHEVL